MVACKILERWSPLGHCHDCLGLETRGASRTIRHVLVLGPVITSYPSPWLWSPVLGLGLSKVNKELGLRGKALGLDPFSLVCLVFYVLGLEGCDSNPISEIL